MAFTYLLVALSLLSLAAAKSPGFGGWKSGRATFYGEQLQRSASAGWSSGQPWDYQSPPTYILHVVDRPSLAAGVDAWSIHKGSCGYGWLDKTIATGGLIAAGRPRELQVLHGSLLRSERGTSAILVLGCNTLVCGRELPGSRAVCSLS